LQVLVRDNNVDQALRVLKKKMQREGVFREMKRRRFYEKPSERANREKLKRSVAPASSLARTPNARALSTAPRGGRVRSSKPAGRGPFSVMSGVCLDHKGKMRQP
jgi:small subunit ribosomal protein S21